MAKTTTKATPATPPPADPLADLRQEWGDTSGADVAPTATTPQEPASGATGPEDDLEGQEAVSERLVTQEEREEQRAQVITAWHADTVSMGFLHRGGRCGCRYLAERVLDAIHPVAPEPEEGEQKEGDGSGI